MPPNIAQMEAELKREYAAAERKAKAEIKAGHVPTREGGTLAIGKKRKQAESSVDSGFGNEYHGLSGIADAANLQSQIKKARKGQAESTKQETDKTASLKPKKKTTELKTEQSLSQVGGVQEQPRQTARKGPIQTARSTKLHAAWLEDPTRGPGPINPATGVSYKHPSEMNQGAVEVTASDSTTRGKAAKKETRTQKESSIKREPSIKKEPAAVKKESAIKKEAAVKKVPSIKKEPATKKEVPIKKEAVVKKEPSIKKESSIKKEPPVKKEPANKREPPIKKETPIKKEPAIKRELPIKKETPIKKEPAIKRELPIKKETPIKKEPKPKKESTIKSEPSTSPFSQIHPRPYGNPARSPNPPSLGLINGIYDLSCQTVEEKWDSTDLTLTLTLDGTTVWGAYDLGMFSGILFLPDRPWQASNQPLPFTWRGRENGEGEMDFGDDCEGEISFLGNGVIEGWISVYGRCCFEGRRRQEAGTAVRTARSMRAEWDGYNEVAYEEERVGRW